MKPELLCKSPFIDRSWISFVHGLEPEREELSVLCSGWEDCQPGYHIRREDFAYNAFEYIHQGQVKIKLAGRQYVCGPGALFGYGPKIPHEIEVVGEMTVTKYFVDICGKNALSWLNYRGLAGGVSHALHPKIFVSLLDAMIEQCQTDAVGSPEIMKNYLDLLMTNKDDFSERNHTNSAAYQKYLQIRNKMESSDIDKLSVEYLAREANISPSHLSRIFKKYSHQSAKSILTQRQMQKAVRMMLIEGKLIKQVAFELGYADAYSFSKAFKRCMGFSPLQYLQKKGYRQRGI